MIRKWHVLNDEKPPEGKILLVCGPLGLDLAVSLNGQWYFKQGDNWSADNLEHWTFHTPLQWMEILALIGNYIGQDKISFDYSSDDISELPENADFALMKSEMSFVTGSFKN